MESLLGILGVTIVTGVLGFAYKMVEAYKEQVTFYQQRLLPAVENVTTVMKGPKKGAMSEWFLVSGIRGRGLNDGRIQ